MRTMGGDHHDQDFLDRALVQLSGALEEPITLNRYTSRSDSPTIDGSFAGITYQSIATTAVVEALGIEKLTMAGGIYAPGDIIVQMRLQPIAFDPSTNTPADQLVWRGATYALVERARPIRVSGDMWYQCIARRITPGTT